MEQLVTSPDNPAAARIRTSHQQLQLTGQQEPGAPRRSRRMRRTLAATALFAAGALALSACGGDAEAGGHGDDKDGQASADAAAAKDASQAKIKVSAKNGATDASINDTGVKVTGGKLTDVKLTVADSGAVVDGVISQDGTSWKPAVQLERGTKYKIVANAKDAKGRAATENATFTTVSSANSFIGIYTPDNGKTVGVGMPVSFKFDKPITNRKDVQSHIKVTSSSGQQVVGHWFGSQRLDFRPENYWKAGSKVTMNLDLDGVEGGEGITGVQSKTVSFTVGRSQVSTVDMNTQTMTVKRDGKTIKSIPISGGSAENPTYNGQMVISEKFKQTRMDGSTVGFTDEEGKGEYDIKDVPHAMRLSTSGTFIHGNYWGDPSIFGRAGTSHGCVGLKDNKGGGGNTPGKWFFENSLVGDVVVVKNSKDETIKPDNGLNGWNMPWSEWQAGSAV
ncbi:L,D-transpeptidase [Streptomyces halobius]|uniref:Ig-like domain-containing protein n=1 Tax=Streptomyces halobius TaxID=2879846 RepID=A0ABY4MAS0_9ACTN|nr:Ig-like domain-containing protein [Streptomyces halobius]UQA94864.1 Ig-like domain-containing protein [Streptomyces halobius]